MRPHFSIITPYYFFILAWVSDQFMSPLFLFFNVKFRMSQKQVFPNKMEALLINTEADNFWNQFYINLLEFVK